MESKPIKTAKPFSENFKFILSVSLPALIAVSGWWVVSNSNAERDRENKLRDVKIDYLIKAYTLITDATVGGITPEEYLPNLNKAWSQIQLVGTAEEIQLAQQMMKDIEGKTNGDANNLLEALRNDLRKELKLPYEYSGIFHLRLPKEDLKDSVNYVEKNYKFFQKLYQQQHKK